MSFVYFICFALVVVGTVILLKLTPEQLTKDLSFLFNRKKSLRDKSLTATGKKKSRIITVELQKIKTALEETGKEKQLSVAIAASVILMIGGAVVAVLIHNPFLIPVLAVAFAMIPFSYLMRTISVYDAQVKGELETALSIITTSYVRSDNIIEAVSENIRHLKPPLRGIFESFVAEATTITPDVRVAIMHMRDKISDTIFEEWCDTLLSCQNDRTLKDTLMPVVAKQTDVRLVNNSLKTMLSEARREYYMMVAMVIANIPLLYCLNKDWYNALMNTVFGKIVLAICGVVIVVTFFKMNKYTKPIEYKR
ncbi:MAG: type II secretion system F family protein [Eubacteriales bacterium]